MCDIDVLIDTFDFRNNPVKTYPFGYPIGLAPNFALLNVMGYSSAISTVVTWAGRSVSFLAYGLVISKVVGTARIACGLFGIMFSWDQKPYLAHMIRGVAECAGLAPLLLLIDLVSTVYMRYNRRQQPAQEQTSSIPPTQPVITSPYNTELYNEYFSKVGIESPISSCHMSIEDALSEDIRICTKIIVPREDFFETAGKPILTDIDRDWIKTALFCFGIGAFGRATGGNLQDFGRINFLAYIKFVSTLAPREQADITVYFANRLIQMEGNRLSGDGIPHTYSFNRLLSSIKREAPDQPYLRSYFINTIRQLKPGIDIDSF